MPKLLAGMGFTLLLMLAACNFIESYTPPTLTPTRVLSGPTLEPSPTIVIQPVEELDDDSTVGQNDLTAAALPSDGFLPPLAVGTPELGNTRNVVQFPATDGTLLTGDLYTSGIDRQPGVLIIGDEPTVWGDFPTRLQSAGFTVLVMPLREPAQVADFQVMLHALSESGAVDPGSMAVIGAATGADMALIGCAVDQLCDTAVLLSPLAGDTLRNLIADYNPRPLLLVASQDDTESYAIVQSLAELATGEVLVQPFTSAGRGVAMLQNRADLGELIIQWLQRHLPS